MLRLFGLTGTEVRPVELSKCIDCGKYFLDINKTGSCCKKEIIVPKIALNKPDITQFEFLRR